MGEPLTATIQKIIELAFRCAQAETSDNYGALADQVEELEGQAVRPFSPISTSPPCCQN
jgi:hypothetical protein